MITAGRVIQMEDATGFPVAVKRWSKKDADKAEWEQKMLRLMNGEGVPKFVRYYEDSENVYVVSEWINGVTLESYVEEAGGFLSFDEALRIGGEILKIVQQFHNSKEGCFVYTDIKPSNVMLKDDVVYLVDAESVRAADAGGNLCDEKTVVMGTRPFTAPEVFTGKIAPECDYYSIGALMFYMITGELCFDNREILSDDKQSECILKLLDPDPEKRREGLMLFAKDSYDIPESGQLLKVAEPFMMANEPKVFLIHDNPRFAVEMAYVAATRMDLKVGVFTVLERDNYYLRRSFDFESTAGTYPFVDMDEEQARAFLQTSDLQQWLDAGYMVATDCCSNIFMGLIQPREICRLLEDHERYLFVNNMKQHFDITLILGEMMRDRISADCDHIIVAVTPDLWETHRTSGEAFDFQDCLGFGGVSHVAWEFKEGISMNVEKFMRFFDKEHYLGEIYYDSNRHIIENKGQLPYCFDMPEIIKQQYQRIIAKLLFQ